MDVLQTIGTNPRRTAQVDEGDTLGSVDWVAVLGGTFDAIPPASDAIELGFDQRVEIELDINLDDPEIPDDVAALTEEVGSSDIVELDIQPGKLKQGVSIQEHVAISGWETGIVGQPQSGQNEPAEIAVDLPIVMRPDLPSEDAAPEIYVAGKTETSDAAVSALSPVGIVAPQVDSVPVAEKLIEAVPLMARQNNPEILKHPSPLPFQNGLEADSAESLTPVLVNNTAKPPESPELRSMRTEADGIEPPHPKEKAVDLATKGAVVDQLIRNTDAGDPFSKEPILHVPIVGDVRGSMQESLFRPMDQTQTQTLSGVSAGSTNPTNTVVPNMTAISKDQPVLLQVSRAVEAVESGKIELRLDPAELGKVRITMSARDGIMFATISAERAETLELLRRNSESLDMTFSEQGFGETKLDFQQFDDDDQTQADDEHSFRSDGEGNSDNAEPGIILQHMSDGLDIKL